jgi:hypothetical protein
VIQDTSDSDDGRAVARRRLPRIIAAIVLLVLGGWYYKAVRSKTEYASSRNLRLLSTVAAQIDGSITTHRRLVQNFAEAQSWCDEGAKPLETYDRSSPGAAREIGNLYAADFDHLKRLKGPASVVLESCLQMLVRDGSGGLALQYEYAAPVQPPQPGAPPWRKDIVPEATCAWTDAPHAIGTLPFDKLLKPLFHQPFLNAFDTLLLVRGDGLVLFESKAGDGRAGERQSGGDSVAQQSVSITALQVLQERSGFRDTKPISMERLRGETSAVDVEVGNSGYKLFAEPYRFDTPSSDCLLPLPSGDPKVVDPQRTRWFICGLVSKGHFDREVFTISASIVALITAALLLIACSAPFLKLTLIGEHQPVIRTDVIVLTVSTVFGIGILTLMLLDIVAYDRMKKEADVQHEAFAEHMKAQINNEIDRALLAADDLKLWSTSCHRWSNPTVAGLANDSELHSSAFLHANLYRYISSFAFINRDGRQVLRGVMAKAPPPLVSVAGRTYFDAVQKRPWYRQVHGVTHPFYIESVQTITFGSREAILAVPGGDSDVPVFIANLAFVQAVKPVTPPGLRFAIIDENGNVLFHSDEQRNTFENLFEEAGENRNLRAAVFSRREEFVDASYWGDDQRIRVTPLADVPWTLLTFRNKDLLRTVNIETTMLALILIGLHVSLLLASLTIATIIRPHYRIPWLWPSEKELGRWTKVLIAFIVSALAVIVSTHFVAGSGGILIGFVAPLQVCALTCLILRQNARPGGIATALIIWFLGSGIWIADLAANGMDPTLLPPGPAALKILDIALLIIAPIGLVFIPLRITPKAGSSGYRSCYVACGVLILVIVSVLPAAAYFRAAYGIQIDSFVKYGQLVMADRLARRLDVLSAPDSIGEKSPAAPGYGLPFFYNSGWCLPSGGGGPNPCDVVPQRPFRQVDDNVAHVVEDLLPQYSENSMDLRDLHHPKASDDSWSWQRSGSLLRLVRRLSVDQKTMKRMQLGAGQNLVMVSQLPSVVPSVLRAQDILAWPGDWSLPVSFDEPVSVTWPTIRAAAWFGVLTGFTALLFGIATFIAKRIFLIDIRPPEWLKLKVKPPLGANVGVVRRGQTIDKFVDTACFPHQIELDRVVDSDDWCSLPAKFDAEAATAVLIVDLEKVTCDSEKMRHALDLLEPLVAHPEIAVVAVSAVAPSTLLAAAPHRLRERWNSVLDAFLWITNAPVSFPAGKAAAPVVAKRHWVVALREAVMRRAEKQRADFTSREHTWDTALQRLPPDYAAGEPLESLMDNYGELADGYYRSVWANCSKEEKLLLYQIATHGLANQAARRTLRRLLGRRLVLRDPELRLFSSTFCCFVVGRAAEVEKTCTTAGDEDSAWDRLQLPLLAGIVIVAGVFLATQKDLLNLTTAIATGLTAGLPALTKIVGLVAARRGLTPRVD